jgi:hypothetical protein
VDWGVGIAAAALVVAVAAWLLNLRQARDGRKSREATEQSAAEATNSRIEAEKTRVATERQAIEATKAREIAEEALAMAKQSEADRIADRDARDAPKYKIVPDGRTHIRVTYVEGPPEVVMRMTRLDIVAQGDHRPEVPVTLALDIQKHRLTRGGSCRMAVDVQTEKSSCSVRIELYSTEADGDREWPWHQEVEFPAPPAATRVSTVNYSRGHLQF